MVATYRCKEEMVRDNGNCKNLSLLKQHLIKHIQLHDPEKLNAKVFYFLLVFFKYPKLFSQKYLQDSLTVCNWCEAIFSLPQITAVDSELKFFQCKILYNVWYLNKKLFIFGKTDTKLYCFSKDMQWKFKNSITDFTECHGFSDVNEDIFLVLSHILLSFKHFIYISEDSNILLFQRFCKHLQKVFTTEQKLSQESERKNKLFHKND